MKKFFGVALILLISQAQAFEIVYPKKNVITINADKTFFIGNEKSGHLKINGDEVKLHSSGGFKHTVELNEGENTFVIDNGKQRQIYKITRPVKKDTAELEMIEYELPVTVITNDDNVPLRSSPVDAGLNRLSHLEKDTELPAIGEYGEFYKIWLARDDFGWISKSNVKKNNEDFIPSILLNTGYTSSETEEIYTFKTDGKKIPYVLSENNRGFDLTLYGLNDNIYPFGKFEFNIAHSGKNFGYSSYFDEKNELTVKINKYTPALEGLKITVDAGHGGAEYGAIGCLGDKEKDVNLKIAKKLKQKLEAKGAQVFMTRQTDKNVGLNERVQFSNKNDSNIFISIHNNAVSDSLADREITGCEVYYFYPQAKELAREIAKSLANETGLKSNGAKGGSFAVIRNSNAVSVLVECAYMINPNDNSKLQEDEFLDKIADGILKGLENYLK